MSRRFTSTGTDPLPRTGFWPSARMARRLRRDEVADAAEGSERRLRAHRPLVMVDPTDAPLPRHFAPERAYQRPAPPLADTPVPGAVVPALPGWDPEDAPHPAGLMRFAG